MAVCPHSAACRCGIVSVTVLSQTMVKLMGLSVTNDRKLQMKAYWSNPRTVPKCVPGPKSYAHTALSTSTTPSVEPNTLLRRKVPLDVNEPKEHMNSGVEWADMHLGVRIDISPAQVKYFTSGLFAVLWLNLVMNLWLRFPTAPKSVQQSWRTTFGSTKRAWSHQTMSDTKLWNQPSAPSLPWSGFHFTPRWGVPC